ncbi:MAG: murein biosynthesis integral membrane protein MurJ [Acidobacteria bacterium]|nr:murein biosynthesis integral membrane protein MurJ [Acidobacteriota bacterium]
MEPTPETAHRRDEGIVLAAGSVSIAIMISRLLGLVREIVLARYFGAGMRTDAFNIAYRIPNLLRDLFAEGALSSAFVPTFVRTLTREGKEEAWLLANRVISLLLTVLAVVTLGIFFGAKLFVYLLAASFASDPEKFELTVQMTRIMSPFLVCIALASAGMGILNAFGTFFVPALASSAFNVCCILAGIFLSPHMPRWGMDPIVAMAVGALAGGMAQFIVMIPSTRRHGFRFRFDLKSSDARLRHILNLMVPAVIGLSATQINITVDSQLASIFGDGPVSYLNYGFRLMQLPIGIFGIAIATVTMVSVSRFSGQVRTTLGSSLRLAACLTFPATVGLILFRHEIVALLYEGGSFTAADTLKTSQVVLLYALGLFSYSAVKIAVPVFYALDDTRTPVTVSLLTVGIKIVLNLILIVPFGFFGLVAATTAASWCNLGLLARQLRKKTGAFPWAEEIRSYFMIVLASCLMGIVCLTVFRISWLITSGPDVLEQIFRLGTAIAAGIAVIFPILRILGVEEGREIPRRIRALLGRSS